MKKIAIIIVCLICHFYTKSQTYPVPINVANAPAQIGINNAFKGKLIISGFADTTAANTEGYLKNYDGALIKTTTPINAVWYRYLAGQQWVQILPSGGSTGTLAWVMGGNNPVVSDGSGNAILGPQTNNGIAFLSNNLQRLILPAAGLTFNQLASDTTLNKVLTYNTSTKAIGYGYWYGGSGATPTWQQTLTAGSTLTGNNTINGGNFNLTIEDVNELVIATTGTGSYTQIGSSDGGNASYFRVESDSIHLQPHVGNFHIDTLNNASTQNQLMGWTSSGGDRGGVGYITVGSGLSLSSGALTSTAGSLTATYIGYGSAGNVLTGSANNTWTAATNIQTIDSGILKFSGSATFGDAGTGAIYKNSTYGLTMRGITGAAYDWLVFDVAGNAVFANHTGTTTFGTSGMFGAGLLGGTISATMHLKAGSTAASSAPLKFNSGSLMTTAEAGAVEFLTDKAYLTITTGAARKELTLNDAALTSGRVPYATTNGRLTDASTFTYDGSSFSLTANGGLDALSTGTTSLGDYNNATGIQISGSNASDAMTYKSATTHTFSTGTVTMSAYGAGTATFDGSGNITSVSDMRLKDLQGMYEVGINRILQINPIVYKWNEKSKLERKLNYIGFSAQNVKDALGENSVGINKDGYYSLQDRAIIAALVNGEKDLYKIIQEQQKQIDELKKDIKRLKNK